MTQAKYIVGKIFGRLTVISEIVVAAGISHNRYLHCRCACDREVNVRLDHLTRGKTVSCGCLSRGLADAKRQSKHPAEYARLLAESKLLGDSARAVAVVAREARDQERSARAAQRRAALAENRTEKHRLREEKKAVAAATRAAAKQAREEHIAASGQEKRHRLPGGTYDQLFKAQAGQCAICEATTKRKLHIDHDHKTGMVRGLLCSPCNTALGGFRDSIMLMAKAMKYLTITGRAEIYSKYPT